MTTTTCPRPFDLFERFGVELEYMIVRRDTLDVVPYADKVLMLASGGDKIVGDAQMGPLWWSNELVSHVLEMKTDPPATKLDGVAEQFADSVHKANELLAPLGACLLGGGSHAWMNPATDTVLWEHEYSEVYQAYNRIFGARGHGWSNLQSAHLNLPFKSDRSFGALHAAIRALLPIMPALSAASPFLDSAWTGMLDARLSVYRTNSARIPSITGNVVPEPVFTEADYRTTIFERMWADIAPHDPDEILREEFLNSRGAIARFSRGSIEVRVLDCQECPAADLAIIKAIVGVLKGLVEMDLTHGDKSPLRALGTGSLAELMQAVVIRADAAPVFYPEYVRAMGVMATGRMTAAELWRDLLDRHLPGWSERDDLAPLTTILHRGPLARRMLAEVGVKPEEAKRPIEKDALHALLGRMSYCLANNQML